MNATHLVLVAAILVLLAVYLFSVKDEKFAEFVPSIDG